MRDYGLRPQNEEITCCRFARSRPVWTGAAFRRRGAGRGRPGRSGGCWSGC